MLDFGIARVAQQGRYPRGVQRQFLYGVAQGVQLGAQQPHVLLTGGQVHTGAKVVVARRHKLLQGRQRLGVDGLFLHQRACGAALQCAEAAQEQVVAQLQPVHGDAARVQFELVQRMVELFVFDVELQKGPQRIHIATPHDGFDAAVLVVLHGRNGHIGQHQACNDEPQMCLLRSMRGGVRGLAGLQAT